MGSLKAEQRLFKGNGVIALNFVGGPDKTPLLRWPPAANSCRQAPQSGEDMHKGDEDGVAHKRGVFARLFGRGADASAPMPPQEQPKRPWRQRLFGEIGRAHV